MANDIKSAFVAVYADGPSQAPSEPQKEAIRTQIGGKLQTEFDALRAILTNGYRTYATKALMDANLAFTDGTMAVVFEPANRGVYRKSGASGTGSWVYFYPLPFTGTMGNLSFAGWQDLNATIGDYNGQTAYVTNDNGSHYDTVNLVTVPNAGVYSWAEAVKYWRWVGFLSTSNIQVRGWTDLQGIAGTYNGQPGKVVNDNGTHYDGVLGINVPNMGEYTWSAVALTWVWASNALTPMALADASTAKTQAQASAIASASSASDSAGYASQAILARDAATASAAATGPQKFYDTYSQANADLATIADQAIVEVFVDETQNSERTRYRKQSGALVFKMLLPAYVKAAADPARNYVTITAPDLGGSAFIDNVLAIQNKSRGTGGTISGNAAINFLDRAGIERAAIGYSRNKALAPNGGYYPNTLYLEIGNPFTTDAETTDFKLINTIKVGGPYWGGAPISYFAMEVVASTGEMTFRAPGTGKIRFEHGPQFGLDNSPQIVGFALANSKARVREDAEYDRFSIVINDAGIGQASTAALAQDKNTLPSYRMSMGGPGDSFWIQRAAPGAALRSAYVDLFRVEGDGDVYLASGMVGMQAKSAAADGQLAVVSLSTSRAALTAKGAGSSGTPTTLIWSPETTGNSIFARFGTEASFTERGSITYNRTSAVTAFNTTSDRRAKDIIGEIDDAVERFMMVRPYRGRMHGAEIDIDLFIADEMQQIAPYAVTGEKDAIREVIVDYDENKQPTYGTVPDYQQLDTSKVIPLLWAVTRKLVEATPSLH